MFCVVECDENTVRAQISAIKGPALLQWLPKWVWPTYPPWTQTASFVHSFIRSLASPRRSLHLSAIELHYLDGRRQRASKHELLSLPVMVIDFRTRCLPFMPTMHDLFGLYGVFISPFLLGITLFRLARPLIRYIFKPALIILRIAYWVELMKYSFWWVPDGGGWLTFVVIELISFNLCLKAIGLFSPAGTKAISHKRP